MADHTNTVDYRSPVYLQMRELIDPSPGKAARDLHQAAHKRSRQAHLQRQTGIPSLPVHRSDDQLPLHSSPLHRYTAIT